MRRLVLQDKPLGHCKSEPKTILPSSGYSATWQELAVVQRGTHNTVLDVVLGLLQLKRTTFRGHERRFVTRYCTRLSQWLRKKWKNSNLYDIDDHIYGNLTTLPCIQLNKGKYLQIIVFFWFTFYSTCLYLKYRNSSFYILKKCVRGVGGYISSWLLLLKPATSWGK